MVFSSLLFLFLFLPVTLLIYYVVPRAYKNVFLFLISLLFYGWGEPMFVFLMLASILINYIHAYLIDKHRDNRSFGKKLVVSSVIINLGLLCFFKYAGFIGNTLNMVLPFLNIPIISIPLPIGISFYTFQTMSCVIDVYRGDAPAKKNFITFGTYVVLFPQLIAGPIVRYKDVADQLDNRRENMDQFVDGVKLFMVGMGKKILVANQMGLLWDSIRATSDQGVLGSWVGIIAYSMQIYFDFSGYSDMAIGLGRMLGFEFLKNFDYPYISKTITEFWRRWHISLSTWFKEYVYIPLGGNRKGVTRQIINLLIVWGCTGFWHGASFNFLLWGLYFGVLLIVEKFVLMRFLKKLPAFIQHIYALFLICIGWVIFYFEDFGEMMSFLGSLFNPAAGLIGSDALHTVISYIPLLMVGILACTPLANKIYQKIKGWQYIWIPESGLCLGGLLLCTASLVSQSYNPFIYFRF